MAIPDGMNEFPKTRRGIIVWLDQEIRGALAAYFDTRKIEDNEERANKSFLHESTLVRLTTVWKNLTHRTWEGFDPQKHD